jgi:NAD(P)-dependent dehydrogenase (short-subunit alcohol dehydrogenase family)
VVTDIDADVARATAEDRRRRDQQDVRDPDSHRAVAKAAAERGRVGLWVNNAGVLPVGTAWRCPTRSRAG